MSNSFHLVVDNVDKRFNTKQGEFIAIRDVNLRVQRGEFVALIGHSGCGKSTLLNLIAGLSDASSGVLVCGGREISGPGPDRGVVFQNHSLLPWLTCFNNVYLAVERVFGATERKPQLTARTEGALNMVGLSHAMHKHPHEISGGMKQRVGIARALAIEPAQRPPSTTAFADEMQLQAPEDMARFDWRAALGSEVTLESAVTEAMNALGAWAATQPGFLSRQSFLDTRQSRWTDVVEWSNLDQAIAAMARSQREPALASVMALIDPATVNAGHFEKRI